MAVLDSDGEVNGSAWAKSNDTEASGLGTPVAGTASQTIGGGFSAGDKYLTLTHEDGSTIYEVREWTVVGSGNSITADAFATSAIGGRDTYTTIGYVDVGSAIETSAASTDGILAHIEFI